MNLLVIVSAIKEELQDLEFLNQKLIRLNQHKYKILLFPLGIGKLNAISSLYKWYYETYKINYKDIKTIEILFLGSCGSYLEDYQNHFIYSNFFTNYDYATLTHKAKALPDISKELQTDIGIIAGDLIKQYSWDFGIINTTDSITLTKVEITNLKEKFHKKHNYFYENLEVYGIAKFCKEFNLPFTSFLCVTNVVNEMGSENWQKNFRDLSKKMNEVLKNYFLYILD